MGSEPNLDNVLDRFDKIASNLEKLSRLWSQLQTATAADYDDLARSYQNIASAIPSIEGFRLRSSPMPYSHIQLARFEAHDSGDPSDFVLLEEKIDGPAAELREYRFRFNAQRRQLVRSRIEDVMGQIADLLEQMGIQDSIGSGDWDDLSDRFQELVRLVSDSTSGHARWQDFSRHLRFREPQDFQDIQSLDWPSVRAEVLSNLYDDDEPIPVELTDLGEVVRSRPAGPITTALNWQAIDAETFERLIFQLLLDTDGYENVSWLMKTNASDRGRDIQAFRVTVDPLSGTQTQRVIVQCKHWLGKSVGRSELVDVIESVKLWEPPIVDILIVATTGRFSQDAVALAEAHDRKRQVPRPILWADSHLEALLARRPHLIGLFRLK